MKITSPSTPGTYAPKISCLFAVSMLTLFNPIANGQEKKIIIEGGPEAVSISDKDGKPEGNLTNRQIAVAASDQKGTPAGSTTSDPRATAVTTDTANDQITILRRELNVATTEAGPMIRMDADVLFDFDKTTIKPSAAVMLDKAAEFIRLSGDGEVEVVGYADAKGSKEYNSDLAWNRSLAVVEFFKKKEGLAEGRFRAVGRGEEGAVAPNKEIDGTDNPQGRKMNRRVEVLIRNQAAAPNVKPALK